MRSNIESYVLIVCDDINSSDKSMNETGENLSIVNYFERYLRTDDYDYELAVF